MFRLRLLRRMSVDCLDPWGYDVRFWEEVEAITAMLAGAHRREFDFDVF